MTGQRTMVAEGRLPSQLNAMTTLAMNPFLAIQRIPRPLWLILAVGLYALLHMLGAVQELVDALPGRRLMSKIYHVIFYAGLAALLWHSMVRPSAGLVILLTMCAGIADEVHQAMSPFRHALVSDVVIDTLAGAAVVGVLVWRRRAAALGPEVAASP